MGNTLGNEGDGSHSCWECWLQRVPSYQPCSEHASPLPEFHPPTEAAYIKWLVSCSERMFWLLQSHAGQCLRTIPVLGLPMGPWDHWYSTTTTHLPQSLSFYKYWSQESSITNFLPANFHLWVCFLGLPTWDIMLSANFFGLCLNYFL